MLYSVSRGTRFMKVLQALVVAACLFLTFVAFEYYNSMCLVLVYLAVLYSLGEIRAQKTQSIKRIIPLVSTLYVRLSSFCMSATENDSLTTTARLSVPYYSASRS